MAEAHAARVPPHRLLDYTYRDLAAAFDGEAIRRRRDRQLHLWAHYQGEGLHRTKALPNLTGLLRKLEPMRVMSPRGLRNAILNMARAMGAKVTRRKKGDG